MTCRFSCLFFYSFHFRTSYPLFDQDIHCAKLKIFEKVKRVIKMRAKKNEIIQANSRIFITILYHIYDNI